MFESNPFTRWSHGSRARIRREHEMESPTRTEMTFRHARSPRFRGSILLGEDELDAAVLGAAAAAREDLRDLAVVLGQVDHRAPLAARALALRAEDERARLRVVLAALEEDAGVERDELDVHVSLRLA